MNSQLFIDDFDSDPLVYFDGSIGLSINPEIDRFILFYSIGGLWKHEIHPLSVIRSIERVSVTPAEFFTSGVGGAKGIGEGIGVAIRNSMEKSKAINATGISIFLRLVENPKVFLRVENENERLALYEALSQIIEGQKPNGDIKRIPHGVRSAFYRPTEKDLQRLAEKQLAEEQRAAAWKAGAARRRKALKLSGAVVLATIAAAFSLFLASKPLYLTASETPGKIGNSAGFMCQLYAIGFDRTVRIGGATADNLLSRDVQVTLPQPNRLNQEFFIFEEGSLAIGRGLSFAPSRMPGDGFRYFIDVAPEDADAFVRLPRPQC